MKTFRLLICTGLLVSLTALSAQEFSKEASNRYVGSSTYTFTSEVPGQLIIENIREMR